MTNVWGILLLLAAVLGRGRGALNSTWWTCSPVIPHHDIQVQQVLGEWYLVEGMSMLEDSVPHSNICVRIKFEQRTSDPGLVMVAMEKHLGGPATYQNNTVNLIDPAGQQGLWELPDIGVVTTVVYLQRDVLVLTHCYRSLNYLWTGVFTRSGHISSGELRAINEALESVGVPEVAGEHLRDPAVCTAEE
ncbi:hypothetical protein PR048_020456 [Dryococelus australis]|uniref:Apolipoprotein D n=1 Tax=Dryococelus australis TaxID=614101 RepID=A0ABQ9H6C8_9NEOP|nr:hypothetical protein PR048_020456 [Dryococelus australis]